MKSVTVYFNDKSSLLFENVSNIHISDYKTTFVKEDGTIFCVSYANMKYYRVVETK